MEVKLTLHPEGNTGSQLCHMGADLMQKLNAKLGTFVNIEMKEGINITCRAWFGAELDGMSVQYSDTVYRTAAQPLYPGNQDSCNRITVLHPVRADSIAVTVIISKIHLVREYRTANRKRESLKRYCSNILTRLCVAKSCVVNCEKMRLGNVYGISHILIDKAAGKSAAETDDFIITKDTDVVIEALHSKEWFEQSRSSKTTQCLGGLQRETQMLKDLIELPLQKREQFKQLGVDPPHGILLRGPPGCGKTSLVQHVSAACGACLIVINGPELFAPHPGETEANLRKTFEKAALLSEEGACILFIDEIDALCSRRGKSSKGQEGRVTGQFTALMDGLRLQPSLLVIGATNRPSALDPALRRPGRFDREVIIGAPSLQQRREILAAHVTSLPVQDDLDLDLLAGVTNGYVGADLAALCHEAAYLAMAEEKLEGNVRKIDQDHFVAAVHRVCPSLQKGAEGLVDLRPVHWSDIGGLDSVKTQIQQAVEWPIKHPEAFQRLGLPPPRGVLLYGPPGCAKTTLVRASATACHATFLAISGAQLYSPFVGDSERLIAEVFQKARACAPAIILLDEIDSIVGKRSDSGRSSGVQERVLSALLNEMDGIGVRLDDGAGAASSRQQRVLEGGSSQEVSQTSQTTVDNSSVLVVAATNRPDLLDEALVRPGRIDRLIYVPRPDTQARRQILGIYGHQFNLADHVLDDVSDKTDMYTGADLENLCREAALCALTEDLSLNTLTAEKAALCALTEDLSAGTVTADHLYQAMKSVTPSLTPDLIQQYSNVNLNTFKHTNKQHV